MDKHIKWLYDEVLIYKSRFKREGHNIGVDFEGNSAGYNPIQFYYVTEFCEFLEKWVI